MSVFSWHCTHSPSGSCDGCVCLWGPAVAVDSPSRRLSSDPTLIIPLSSRGTAVVGLFLLTALRFAKAFSLFAGISSVCVRDDWNCFVAATLAATPLPSSASADSPLNAVAPTAATSQPCCQVMMFSTPAGNCRWNAHVPFEVDVVTMTSRGNPTSSHSYARVFAL